MSAAGTGVRYDEPSAERRDRQWEIRDTAGETVHDLRGRLLDYALAVVQFCSSLPDGAVAQVLGRQLLKSGTSPGAQHREAMRARSLAEFVSRMESAPQELDETDYWLQLLLRAQVCTTPQEVHSILRETQELMAIFAASVRTAKRRRDQGSNP